MVIVMKSSYTRKIVYKTDKLLDCCILHRKIILKLAAQAFKKDVSKLSCYAG